MDEIWVPLKSANCRYEVSNIGNVRNSKTGKVLKKFIDTHGYFVMSIRPEYKK